MWAVVEVMGHNVFPGWVTATTIGGAAFIRVDVPEIPERVESRPGYGADGTWGKHDFPVPAAPGYTKLIGPGSIYCITPCTEEVARQVADQRRQRPVTVIDFPQATAIAAANTCEDDEGEDAEIEEARSLL